MCTRLYYNEPTPRVRIRTPRVTMADIARKNIVYYYYYNDLLPRRETGIFKKRTTKMYFSLPLILPIIPYTLYNAFAE